MAQTSTTYLSYTIPNSVLIKQLNMMKHPEGGEPTEMIALSELKLTPNHIGYFVETDRQTEQVPSPFAGGLNQRLGMT